MIVTIFRPQPFYGDFTYTAWENLVPSNAFHPRISRPRKEIGIADTDGQFSPNLSSKDWEFLQNFRVLCPTFAITPRKIKHTAFLCYIYWITGQLTCHSAIPELIPGTGSSSTQAHASLTRLHTKAFQRRGYSATWILSLMSCCFLALLGSVVSEVFCSLWFMFMVWPVVITHTSTDLAKYQYLNK